MLRIFNLIFFTFAAKAMIAQDSIFLASESKIFAANVVSAGEFEFNTSFTSDHSTVFFTRGTINWDILALFSSSLKNNKWQQPVLLPFSGKYRDADPFVSFDGKRLFFISDRPLGEAEYKDFEYHIFYVELNGSNIITDPKVVQLPLPEGMKPLYPSVAANGNIYFTATNNGNNDIYVCEWKNNEYLAPRLLPFNSSSTHDLDPVVAFDESFLIFTSNNRKGLGGNDLYISFQKEGTWTEPINLGSKINSRGSEMAPGLSRDNKKLYFTAYKEKINRASIDQRNITADKLLKLMHSYQNGIGNIYEIDISSLVQKGS